MLYGNVRQLKLHAKVALHLAYPSIKAVIDHFPNRNALYVVILDPHCPYSKADHTSHETIPVLAERTFGEIHQDHWKRDFRTIARQKAFVCLRTGMSSRTVGERAPYLYKEGDTKFPGGVVCDGLIVAASGLDWQFDEAVSHMVIALFWAQVRMERDETMNAGSSTFTS